MKRRAKRDAPQRRRRSRTQSEYFASLDWNIKDAKEALRAALSMENWNGVIKYAKQLQVLEEKRYRATRVGPYRRYDPRHSRWTKYSGLGMTRAQMEASEEAARRGRTGPP